MSAAWVYLDMFYTRPEVNDGHVCDNLNISGRDISKKAARVLGKLFSSLPEDVTADTEMLHQPPPCHFTHLVCITDQQKAC